MRRYRVSFNFDTGWYDVVSLEDMSVLSSHKAYTEARDEMERLENEYD